MKEIRIGTSGWNYSQWKGLFYPEKLPSKDWLSFYASYFDTVELNVTFYRNPRSSTFQKWKEKTPSGFLFAVKAHRFLTHIKRLKDIKEPLKKFYQSLLPLEEKLGPILFQLPPSLKYDRTLIEDFLSLLDPNLQNVLEVRNKSFVHPEFFSLLKKARVALCISDTAGKYPLIEEITADFFYIRLHGSRVLYRSCYSPEELKNWVQKISQWSIGGYVYFDNDMWGWAIPNALELKKLLGLASKELSLESQNLLDKQPK